MMTEECIVLKVKASTAYISLVQKDKCGGCKACAFGRSKKVSVPAIMDIPCKEGDIVLVEMPQKESVFSLLIFVIPLVFLVIGFIVGGLFNSDIARFLTALAFCAGSVGVYIPIERAFRRRREFMPVITEIIKSAEKYE